VDAETPVTPTDEQFLSLLNDLKGELVLQADRVLAQTTIAVDCCFNREDTNLSQIEEAEKVIDQADVEIERHSVPLLAMGQTDPYAIRSVLTIVKVNNELERIADCAANIANAVSETPTPSDRFKVMANSVLGMLRDSNRSLADGNADLARQVLSFDDAVNEFKREIVLDAQRGIAEGRLNVEEGFSLMKVTKSLERIADHCTNICEQVIYLETGKIMRHDAEGWGDAVEPEA
jgi:phosphate transport system protein